MKELMNFFMTLTALALLIYLNSKAVVEKQKAQFTKLFVRHV